MIRRPPRSTRTDTLFPYTTLFRSPKPVIARVRGYAIGGGNVIATICDLTIAGESAVFGQVGPKVGSVDPGWGTRSEEHTSELQSLMRISYAVFCLKKKTKTPLIK